MKSIMNQFKLSNIRVSGFWLVVLTATWISLFANIPTLQSFWRAPSAGAGLSAIVFTLGGWSFTFFVIYGSLLAVGCFFWGRSIKIFLAIALVAASVLSFFSMSFGTQFDKTMLVNMLQTHTSETLELVSFRLLVWVSLVGVLPAVFIWRVTQVPEASMVRRLVRPTVALASVLVVCVALVFSMYSKYASAARNRHISFSTIAPVNIVAAGFSHFYSLRASSTIREARGEDAHQSYALEKPRLFFLIVGETARAKNHTLNGYERNTTPNMVARNGYYFPNTESCGTSTAVSVPCMFSGYSRAEFSLEKGRSAETLFDVISRSGARAIWRDNDSGCKGVCAKTEYEDFTDADNLKWCSEKGQCFDEILLDGLNQKILKEKRDTIVVLHLKGSHGPAYYKRYPPTFEHFKPTCKTNDLSQCSKSELINTYDNTIVYTDHIVGEVIKRAEELSKDYATAVMYVSDHGESLGEGGLFLHGLPYSIAPEEQTRVPMYAWVSPEFVKLERWDRECMVKETKVARSHDNVYSTILGFLDIDTVAYNAALDLFESCDKQAVAYRKAGKPAKE